MSGYMRAFGRRPWMQHPASVRAAGPRGQQVFDCASVVAENVSISHAEPAAIVDDDAARFEWLGGLFNGLAAAGHAKIRADCAKRFDDGVGPRLEIALGD